MTMLNIAIIGTGAIASFHIEAYKKFPDRCRIVALCDMYPEKAERLNEKYQLSAEVVSDYTALLKRNDIDLISVCTPPYTHAGISIDFLDAGKHVLVEKPMASSLEECDAMNKAAEKSGKVLSVVAQNRFTNPMMKLKSVLESKLIGSVVHAQVDSFWWRGHSYYDLWWRGTWEKEGGGCTLNHAVHHIDIFLWMNGAPEEITAVTSNVSHDNSEVEDISIAIGKYPDGSLAQITSSVVHHGEEQQLIFQGKHARISSPWKVKASKSRENGFPENDDELEGRLQALHDLQPDLAYEGHTGQIFDVLTAIQGNQQVLIDGIQGRRTLELITAIYEAATTGKKVKLPLDKGSRFYSRAGIIENAIHFYEKKAGLVDFEDNTINT